MRLSRRLHRSNSSSAHARAADTSLHRSNPCPQPATPKPTPAPKAASAPPNTHTPPAFSPERWNRGAFASFSRIPRIPHQPSPVNSICHKSDPARPALTLWTDLKTSDLELFSPPDNRSWRFISRPVCSLQLWCAGRSSSDILGNVLHWKPVHRLRCPI